MRRAMNTFQTRGGCAVSGADRGILYEEETDHKEHQACVLLI